MALLVPNILAPGTSESVAGRYSMSIQTSVPKVSSDDRPFYHYGWGIPDMKQTNPLTEISNKILFQLALDYINSLRKIECKDYTLSHEVFTKIISVLITAGISIDKITIESTRDESLLIRGNTKNLSYYFEVYFDIVEYPIGYEVISNIYENKELLVSVSGSIDFVVKKVTEKTSLQFSV